MRTEGRLGRAATLAAIVMILAVDAGTLRPAVRMPPAAAGLQAAALAPITTHVPPMGWNSWNAIGLAVDEAGVMAQARALVSSGLAAAGYDYVVLDGGWRAPRRDFRGEMQANPAKFPDGIEAVAAYVHGLGLKFGLHQPLGLKDCSSVGPGTQTAPGGEAQDAATFARWGVDFVKYDLCGYRYPPGTTPGAPDFDALVVRDGGTVLGQYQAVSATSTLSGGASTVPCVPCAAGAAVTGIGLRDGRLRFEGVLAPADGVYTADIRYVNVDRSSAEMDTALRRQREALLSVDQGPPVPTLYPILVGPDASPTGWGTVSTISVPVQLHRGANTLTLSDPGSFEEVIRAAYQRMADALRATGRPMMLSISEHGEARPWLWAPALGAMWRTTNDVRDLWDGRPAANPKGPGETGILTALEEQVGLDTYAGRGRWNDPDMLQVGNGAMSAAQDRAQFSLWSILAAPLFASADLARMSDATRQILLDREVIAVDQDPLGIEGRRIFDDSAGQVWIRPLADRSVAVVLLNTGPEARPMAVRTQDLGLRPAFRYSVRDLWAHSTTLTAGVITTIVPSRGVAMYRVGIVVPENGLKAPRP
jgi:alpha-galactosidase